MPALVGLWCVATLLALAVAAWRGAPPVRVVLVYGGSLSGRCWPCRGVMALWTGAARAAGPADRACRAWARISASMRSPRSFCSSSISAARWRASRRSAMAGTRASPLRVLPFFPAYLAGMNLVVLADDAFIVSDRLGVHVARVLGAGAGATIARPENTRAGYIYLVMASFGTLCAAARLRPAGGRGRRLCLRRDAGGPSRRAIAAGSCCCWCSSARDRKPAWCRCTSGCRSRIRPRRATSPR